jgi:hypothetical protein
MWAVSAGALLSVACSSEPARVAGVEVRPPSATSGTPSTVDVRLTSDAPEAGAIVTLAVDAAGRSLVSGLPGTLQVPAGRDEATVTVMREAVDAPREVAITASLNESSQSATLTLLPLLSAVAVEPASAASGTASELIVTLGGPAPAGGAIVALGYERPGDEQIVELPRELQVPGGETRATATVMRRPAAQASQVVITASLDGVTRTATITVVPGS